jgi:hypothetical protein
MMMTFKFIPLTAKNRAMVLIQKQHENTAQAAYMKARNALMVALASRSVTPGGVATPRPHTIRAIPPIISRARKADYMRTDFEQWLVWAVIAACGLLGIVGLLSGAVAH